LLGYFCHRGDHLPSAGLTSHQPHPEESG
jgi:hypothetical protein